MSAGRGVLESLVHWEGDRQQNILALNLSDLGQIVRCGFQTTPWNVLCEVNVRAVLGFPR